MRKNAVINSHSDLLQRDLDRHQEWGDKWLMHFNPIKCQVIRITSRKSKMLIVPYSIHNSVLREVKAAMYLGVTIDDRLTWNEHVDTVVKKD